MAKTNAVAPFMVSEQHTRTIPMEHKGSLRSIASPIASKNSSPLYSRNKSPLSDKERASEQEKRAHIKKQATMKRQKTMEDSRTPIEKYLDNWWRNEITRKEIDKPAEIEEVVRRLISRLLYVGEELEDPELLGDPHKHKNENLL